MAIVVTIQADRGKIVRLRIDEAVIRRYIGNRLNDARNVFIRAMSGPLGRDMQTGRSVPGAYPKTDSGRLANSVDFEVGEREGRLYTDIEYAIYLATGTGRMAPRKMLVDALNEVMDARPNVDELVGVLKVE